jgi:hypothetical protein
MAADGSPPGPEITMKCEAGSDAWTISCVVKNASGEDFFLLTSPFVLEGPKGGDEYFYKHTGGERIENTLEYGYPEAGPLGDRILIDPIVHFRIGDLPNLCRVESQSKSRVIINLAEVAGFFEGSSEWNLRPKTVVAQGSRLRTFLQSSNLQDQCKSELGNALVRECLEVEEAMAAAPWEGIQYSDDGCLDRLSMQFEHVYASQIRVTLPVAGE